MTAVYEERFCAFVDILGFTALIADMRSGKLEVESVRNLLEKVHAPDDRERFKSQTSGGFRAQSISDAVAISANADGAGLFAIFNSLSHLTINLLKEGYFIRGGICKGPLYHDEKMVFGDALVRAYTMESQIARFPRIIVASDVVKLARSYGCGHYIERSEDGPYFMDALYRVWRQVGVAETKEASDAEDRLTQGLCSKIQQRFDEAVDNPRHFEKVQWFARYWNGRFRSGEQVPRVKGPGLDPKPAYWG